MPKTILEIKDEKGQLTDANKVIFDAADAEKRSMSTEEKSTVAENLQKLDDLDLQLRNSVLESNTEGIHIVDTFSIKKPEERFSLIKAINAKVSQTSYTDFTKDVFVKGAQEMRHAGLSPTGDMIVPSVIPLETRATILAGTATQGQEVVAEQKHAILPPLSDKLVFTLMGATYIPGLVGDVSLPTYAGTTVAWKTEVQAAADGGGAFAEVIMKPLRITAFLYVSKTFLAQDGVGAEQLLYDNIIGAAARLIESTVLGVAIGVAGTQPGSMGYQMEAAHANSEAKQVPTNASIIAMETAVDTWNVTGEKMAYVTNSAGRGILKAIDKGVANDIGDFLCSEDNKVNGYPLFVTNSASAVAGTDDGELLVFGNWADLLIGQWGGYDITVDPYSRAGTNQVVITINAYVDVVNARGTNGAGADIEAYYKSFKVMAIKA